MKKLLLSLIFTLPTATVVPAQAQYVGPACVDIRQVNLPGGYDGAGNYYPPTTRAVKTTVPCNYGVNNQYYYNQGYNQNYYRTCNPNAGAAMGAGEQIERAVEEGALPSQRMTASVLGAATGLTEALPVELAFARAMKLMPGSVMNQGLQIVRNAALTGGVEAAQEAAQNFLQNLIAKNVYKPDQELIEGVGEGAAYGAGAGAIFQAALDLTVGRKAVRTARKAQEAKTPQEAAEKIAEEVANPELTEEEKKQRQRAEIRQKQLDFRLIQDKS